MSPLASSSAAVYKLSERLIKVGPVRIDVQIELDEGAENPMNWDGAWTIYTLGRRSLITDVRNRDAWIEDHRLSPGFRSKLRAGTAFPIWVSSSHYRLDSWAPTDDWYSVDGFVVWEHAPGDLGADRKQHAATFLSEYTKWANGECYWYSVSCEETDYDDSCGGFIGAEYLLSEVKNSVIHCMAEYELSAEDVEIIVTGDAADLWDGEIDGH